MNKRGSGILMHISSLPSPYGIGDLGPDAYKFVDFLARTNQMYWQVLPLNPTSLVLGNSPYSSTSAIAGNTLLISPELLFREGYLNHSDLQAQSRFPIDLVDYEAVTAFKKELFDKAYERFAVDHGRCEYTLFCEQNKGWLDDYAFFTVLKAYFHGSVWSDWPFDLRDRNVDSMQQMHEQLADKVEKEKFLQFVFFLQWTALKEYANERGIQIIGDIPIYVNFDSSDAWAHPEIFKLGQDKRPLAVSGVPPDYFSSTGQLWGNPVYNWDLLRTQGFKWWVDRVRYNLELYNIIRIDHFRGLVAYWEVPSGEKTAVNGRWVEVPVYDFFSTLFRYFPYLPIVAEDLGTITPDVREVMRKFSIPGMQVLLFAFGEDHPIHPYLPHNYVRNSMAYTGTHDNNTVRGWFRREASPQDKLRLFKYIGRDITEEEVSWEMIRLAMEAVCNVVVIPMQDILSLSEEARMNIPATTVGNWQWRVQPHQINEYVMERLAEMTYIYGRT